MNIDQNQYGAYYRGGQDAAYFRKYAGKNEAAADESEGAATKNEEAKSYREQIQEKMEEMAENIRKGNIQPKFRIGAQEYTIKEWEKFLEKFDAAEEAMQEAVQAHVEEVKEQAEREAVRRAAENGTPMPAKMTQATCDPYTDTTDLPAVETLAGTDSKTLETEEAAALLTDEVTKCSYPTEDPRQKHWYITCYGQDGISCKEAYYDGTRWINRDLWSLSYTEKGQYEKVMAFLQRFPQDANLRFAAHENFWKDFLAGRIDEDDFAAFFETTKDGVPDYTYEKDGSTYIDRDKIKYAKYMNGFGAQMYTREEMELIQRAVLHENRKKLHRLPDSDGRMPVPAKQAGERNREEDDLETRLMTKADGSVVLQICTNYGMMELEVVQAQKFGLMVDVRADNSGFEDIGFENISKNS